MVTQRSRDLLVLLDSATCHKPMRFKRALSTNRLDYVFIPASMTSILQMADVEWLFRMKARYRRQIAKGFKDCGINSEPFDPWHDLPRKVFMISDSDQANIMIFKIS